MENQQPGKDGKVVANIIIVLSPAGMAAANVRTAVDEMEMAKSIAAKRPEGGTTSNVGKKALEVQEAIAKQQGLEGTLDKVHS